MSEHIPLHELSSASPINQTPSKSANRPTPAQLGGKIHTRSFSGYFRRLRLSIAGTLALLFFGTSWINWQGHQAVLWDLTERKFYVFGITYLPEDFLLLSFVMCISAFLLLAATVVAGRVWCGYACPQSTWTRAFMWMEKITEGDSYQRVKLDAAPWSLNKFMRRSGKHLLWTLASLASGIAFMGYFMPVRELVADFFSAQLNGDYLFWVLFIAGMTYLNAGWLREKVCTHMCPYARFQSVMFDKDTLIIGYDAQRGEGRGSRRKEDDYQAQGLGDCIDCHMCVQVCPTGIDIRDGLQMDCIGCAACVDACDSIMDKMGYARGLVSYTSERHLETQPQERSRAKPGIRWRSSLIAYASAIFALLAILALSLNAREQMALNVYRDRSVARINANGEPVNVYLMKMTNKTQQPQTYRLTVASDTSLQLSKIYELKLIAGERVELPIAVTLKHQDPIFGVDQQSRTTSGHITFEFEMTNIHQPEQHLRQSASFIYQAQ
jgi:cytochrome c oxidase accessory protein FixG